jgi:hypothetical protein
MENRKSLRSIIVLLVFLVTTLGLASGCQGKQWIYFHDEEIRGYVVDADTAEPIEGAIVVSMWQLSQMLSEGFGGYAKVIETKTDKEGKFIISAWKIFKPLTADSVMHDFAPKVIIYKPGYKVYGTHKVLWEGYPNDYSRTDEEKRKLKVQYSINPAKLKKIYEDEKIWKSYLEFLSEANLSIYDYTAKQFKTIFDFIKCGLAELPIKNNGSRRRILSDMKQYEN